MDPSTLPIWAQNATVIAIALTTALVGVFKYIKTEAKAPEEKGSAAVLSASFIDSKTIRELIDTIREFQDESGRDNKKHHRLAQDLKETMSDLNDTIIVQTDTTMNLVRFLNREASKNKELV